ncbi:MAG: hypothetical protein H0S85_13800 [Desulfovibrionaceae bacterium]|jgi:hypothetical protein|nr:hypothetical protein [Desulfovibrionaceae bacterium]
MEYLHAAAVPRGAYDTDETVRARIEGVHRHLRELALDVGLDPDGNVLLDVGEDAVRVGLSPEMDEYLRDAEPGLWMN